MLAHSFRCEVIKEYDPFLDEEENVPKLLDIVLTYVRVE